MPLQRSPRPVSPVISFFLSFLLIFTAWAALVLRAAAAQPRAGTRPNLYVPGRRAVVIDERLSALRTRPDLKAPLVQRLRRCRRVGILSAAPPPEGGLRFQYVAVTRNVRGWVLAEALVRPGRLADAERLMGLINETTDDFVRARLARLCADEFRSTAAARRALLALGEAAERAAERLSRDARRRVGNQGPGARADKRDYWLNDLGLDRYNRLGVTFDYDEAGDRLSYDGGAYRELLRRYPRSAEAEQARQRLERLGRQ
jgi:hypothetical protein